MLGRPHREHPPTYGRRFNYFARSFIHVADLLVCPMDFLPKFTTEAEVSLLALEFTQVNVVVVKKDHCLMAMPFLFLKLYKSIFAILLAPPTSFSFAQNVRSVNY